MFVCRELEKTLQARMPHSHTFKMPRESWRIFTRHLSAGGMCPCSVVIFSSHFRCEINTHVCAYSRVPWSWSRNFVQPVIFAHNHFPFFFFFALEQQLNFAVARKNFNISGGFNSWSILSFTLRQWKLVRAAMCFA